MNNKGDRRSSRLLIGQLSRCQLALPEKTPTAEATGPPSLGSRAEPVRPQGAQGPWDLVTWETLIQEVRGAWEPAFLTGSQVRLVLLVPTERARVCLPGERCPDGPLSWEGEGSGQPRPVL